MLRSVIHLESVRAYVDALVHPSARTDALTAARHRSFIAVRLLCGLVILSVVPVYLMLRGVPTPLESAVFAWLLAPLLVAAYLSRTGDFEGAHIMSAGALAALVALISAGTGGIASFMTPWLAVLPIEAALAASRRVILTTIAMAVATIAGLWALGAAGLVAPQPAHMNLPAAYTLGTLSAALYASAVALGIASFARFGERIRDAGDARYRLLAQNTTDMITRHARNGAATFVSQAAERLVGVPATALMGNALFEYVHVADRPRYLTALSEAARGGDVAVEYRLRQGPISASHAAPGYVWVETRYRSVDGRSGEVVAVTRDVSRSKQDAVELESARTEAEKANATKSRFLATVSHELRTPLNAIIGFSEMLENEISLRLDAERRMDYARVIRESGQHLLAVVNGILDVSRIEAGQFNLKLEPVSVATELEACHEMMVLRAEQAGVRLTVEIEQESRPLVADRIALRQILINLISNAVKFTPRGGSVAVNVRDSGADLLIVVADTGIGISEDDLRQVGDPFFQAASSYDRTHEGTGLGLSVVKGLVDLHGGAFSITSRLGEGTRVCVRLPRAAKERDAGPQPGIVQHIEPRAPEKDEVEMGKVKRSA